MSYGTIFLSFIASLNYLLESDKVVLDAAQEDDLSESSFTPKIVQLKAPAEMTLCQ